jgi:hypothetical protein
MPIPAVAKAPSGSMPIPSAAKAPSGSHPIPAVAKAPSGSMPIPQAVMAAQAHPVLAVAPPPRPIEPIRIIAPAVVAEPDPVVLHAAAGDSVDVPSPEILVTPARRRVRVGLMAVVTAVVIVLSGGATLAAMRYLAAPDISEAPAITGTLVVTSQPTGAQASIDGTVRGATPLTVSLPAGRHTLRLTAPGADARSLPLTIPAGGQVAQHIELGQDAVGGVESAATEVPLPPAPADPAAATALPLDGGPAAGWIAVNSRFEVKLYEQGQLLGSSQSARIMVPTGKHDLELVSDEIGYKATKSVQVVAGKIAPVAVDAPTGTVALNALPWAEVSIDGNKIGETPIGNLSVPVGAHEVVFRHPELGEKRQTIVVTLKAPARITADLRQP